MSLKHVSDHNFTEQVASQGITLVDFGAVWCPPCKTLLPILEQLDQELSGTGGVSILKLDVDESPKTASAFGVMSMPTVILFKDGEPLERLVGLRPKEVYSSLIQKHRQ